jgi:NADPH:quinone reductase-like Zn-dependent oxidoreductase
VLIYGASGSIGTTALQLARYYGAEVTGVCSTANLALVRSLGADKVIDYTTEEIINGERYDLIFDAVGKNKTSKLKSQCRKALTPNGKYISVDSGSPAGSVENLLFIKKLAEAGHLKPVIDRRYPLEQIVDAHRYVDTGHKKGSVVITIHDEQQKAKSSSSL